MRRRLILILCVMTVFFTTGVICSFAGTQSNAGAYKVKTDILSMNEVVNPLYENLLSKETLEVLEEQNQEEGITRRRFYTSTDKFNPNEYKTDYKEVVADFRQQMVERNTNPRVMYYVEVDDINQINDIASRLFYDAMEHTGDPQEGDALRWIWATMDLNEEKSEILSFANSDNAYWITLDYHVIYYTTAQQEAELTAAVENLKYQLNIDDLSNYQKVCVIYDYMCSNIIYDYDNLDDESYVLKYTAYAALVDKTAVCQGYAALFYRMALEYDIDARVISGDAGGPHGWNIVNVGTKYYYCDATWDAGQSSYNYFLKGSTAFLTDHALDAEFTTSAFQSAYPVSSADYVYDGNITVATPATNLMTVKASGKPKLSWSSVDGATRYEVWRKVGSGGEYEKYYTTVSGTSMTNNRTIPGNLYYYKVRALTETASDTYYSAFSKVKYIACDCAQPTTKLTTVASSGKPKLTWNKVTGASKYQVYRKVGSSGSYGEYYTTTGTSLTNKSTTPGTVYYYKVRAICENNSGGNSACSEIKSIACDLAQPKGLKVTTVASSGKPKVSWNKVTGATKYEVWRKIGADGTYVRQYTTTGTSYTNTSATAGKVYYYKVKAICRKNSGGNSAFSTSDYVTCDLARPKITVSGTKKPGKIVVSWNKVTGADRYHIYRATSKNGTYSEYGSTTLTTWTNTSVKKGKTYYYKVKAVYDGKPAATSAYSHMDYARVR